MVSQYHENEKCCVLTNTNTRITTVFEYTNTKQKYYLQIKITINQRIQNTIVIHLEYSYR